MKKLRVMSLSIEWIDGGGQQFCEKGDDRSAQGACGRQLPMSYGGVGWKGTKARFTMNLEFEDKSLHSLGEFTTES